MMSIKIMYSCIYVAMAWLLTINNTNISNYLKQQSLPYAYFNCHIWQSLFEKNIYILYQTIITWTLLIDNNMLSYKPCMEFHNTNLSQAYSYSLFAFTLPFSWPKLSHLSSKQSKIKSSVVLHNMCAQTQSTRHICKNGVFTKTCVYIIVIRAVTKLAKGLFCHCHTNSCSFATQK